MSAEIQAIAEKFLAKTKPCGNDQIMALCPFHPDETPSFTMSLTRGVYLCFSCKESGSLTTFLRAMGVSRARIDTEYKYILEDIERYRPKKADPLRVAPAAPPLPEAILGLFEYCPTALLQEGFEESLLAKLDVGYDKVHERITFPLRDERGRLIGISGRTVTDERPRYKVYDTEYEVWGLPARDTKKRSIIWNLHNVFPHVYFANDQSVVVVEGFKACMKLMQSGIKNTIALLGSYMSKEQQWAIERLGARTYYLMLDNDDAGFAGRESIGRTLSKSLSDVRVVQYEADQPSDLEGEEIADALATATEYHLWKIRQRSTIEQPNN